MYFVRLGLDHRPRLTDWLTDRRGRRARDSAEVPDLWHHFLRHRRHRCRDRRCRSLGRLSTGYGGRNDSRSLLPAADIFWESFVQHVHHWKAIRSLALLFA